LYSRNEEKRVHFIAKIVVRIEDLNPKALVSNHTTATKFVET